MTHKIVRKGPNASLPSGLGGGAVDASYPNKPAGTSLIGSSDGSVEESGGSAFGIPEFGGWQMDASAPDNHIEVVSDATNPEGSAEALRFTWNDAYNPRSGTTTAVLSAQAEMYIMLRLFLESGFGLNPKLFYFGVDGGRPGPTDFYLDFSLGNGQIRLVNQNAGDPTVVIDSDEAPPTGQNEAPMITGEWLNIELHVVAESSVGSADGEAYMWVNETLVGSRTGLDWGDGTTTGFTGLRWYGDASTTGWAESYYRVGELYMAGIS